MKFLKLFDWVARRLIKSHLINSLGVMSFARYKVGKDASYCEQGKTVTLIGLSTLIFYFLVSLNTLPKSSENSS